MNDPFAEVESRIPSYWTEIFPVVRGLRSTGIVELAEEDVPFFKDFLQARGLSFEMVTAAQFNEERRRRGQDPLRNYYHENLFYIGDELRKVKTLLDCDYNNDFFCVGMMLGYPDCCVAAFFTRGTESMDIEKLKARFSMITHIPCSENCPRTAEYDNRLRAEKERYLMEKAESRSGDTSGPGR